MKRVLRLAENTQGRDFVVGDIHGMFSLLDRALELVRFDPEKDRLISVGDLVNRGPESPRALEFINRPYVHALRGNNEDILLDILGSKDVYTRYKNEDARQRSHNSEDRKWSESLSEVFARQMRNGLEKLPIAIEVESDNSLIGFVHANVPAQLSWQEFTAALDRGDKDMIGFAMWDRARAKGEGNENVPGAAQVFYGHTISDHVQVKGNNIFLDTGAFYCDPVGATYYPPEFADFKGHLTIAQIGLSNEFYARATPKKLGAIHAITEHGAISLKSDLDLG